VFGPRDLDHECNFGGAVTQIWVFPVSSNTGRGFFAGHSVFQYWMRSCNAALDVHGTVRRLVVRVARVTVGPGHIRKQSRNYSLSSCRRFCDVRAALVMAKSVAGWVMWVGPDSNPSINFAAVESCKCAVNACSGSTVTTLIRWQPCSEALYCCLSSNRISNGCAPHDQRRMRDAGDLA